jgi:isoquinoline 1-oxidoreductase beta subunit
LTYGALAADAAKVAVPANPTLKTAAEFKLIGTSPKKLDTAMKSDGTAPFGMDYKMPGMLYAAIERCPVFEGKVKTFDAAKAKTMPGVKEVFSIGHGVAVVATNTWAALQAKKAVAITWDEGPRAGNSTASLRKMFADLAATPGQSAQNNGNVDTALAGAARKVEAVYEAPYLSHAPMEPLNATVLVSDTKVDVWVGTQIQTVARQAAAAATGLKEEAIDIHTLYLGGGFGRRGGEDYIHEAVEVAKHMKGTPVKTVWSREDDLQHDTYRPCVPSSPQASTRRLARGLHANVVRLEPNADRRHPDMKYAIPNFRCEQHSPDVGIPVSWASVGLAEHAVHGSFIDEMAAAPTRTLWSPPQAARESTAHAGVLPGRKPVGENRCPQAVSEASPWQHRQLNAQVRRCRHRRQGEGPQDCVRGGLRRGRQPGHRGAANRKRHRLWAGSGAEARHHVG